MAEKEIHPTVMRINPETGKLEPVRLIDAIEDELPSGMGKVFKPFLKAYTKVINTKPGRRAVEKGASRIYKMKKKEE
jgi:hypothetical protein